jgi:hypothetical protein
MKRYLVAVTGLKADDEKAIINFARKKGVGWWHRISNVWLIVDPNDKTSAEEIRDLLFDMSNSKVGLVLEGPAADLWVGFAAKDQAEETFTWLDKNWTKQN